MVCCYSAGSFVKGESGRVAEKIENTFMKLSELGLDRWFIDQAGEFCESGQQIARVTVVDRGWYTVRNEDGEVLARATGRFLHSTESTCDMPCVGDWVCLRYQDDGSAATIHAMLPRKSFLQRKFAGKRVELQMIAANVDAAFIVQSCNYDFNVSRLERYLVMVNEGRVEPLLILSKTDLVSADELEELIAEIRRAGINTRIIAISNITGSGLEEIREVMDCGRTYCIVGSSGVGKSTLINRLTGDDSLKTGAVGDSGEGRHTTVRRQLIVLEQGAMLIDTPGMREVGLLGVSEGMDDNFDDIQELSLSCRFSNCSHTSEPGCAVVKAIEEGDLQEEHFQNYLKLKMESDCNALSYAGKRKKKKTL
ncbi:ribosome small subunit-dependent GTPase A [Desulfocapsa sulfexigens DSM 10523]|uniref:Small ribosomal subunit biogenesis GTPase RsgA n=1 Tax=Desulfocapsa sulfexigens (strain DSM 10523 / SB164P1) TaxID=1167006 RepID=M1P8L3_DESSD|nr:ribosome small subunit-dependent GTPase A [Desulfocapsa sulfexigens DSM 10523]